MQLAFELILSNSLNEFQQFYKDNRVFIHDELARATARERIDFLMGVLPIASDEILIDIDRTLRLTISNDLQQLSQDVANDSHLLSGQAEFFQLLINTTLEHSWGNKLALELLTNFKKGNISFSDSSASSPIRQIYYFYFTLIINLTNQDVKIKLR